jgi:hypothetical protein
VNLVERDPGGHLAFDPVRRRAVCATEACVDQPPQYPCGDAPRVIERVG